MVRPGALSDSTELTKGSRVPGLIESTIINPLVQLVAYTCNRSRRYLAPFRRKGRLYLCYSAVNEPGLRGLSLGRVRIGASADSNRKLTCSPPCVGNRRKLHLSIYDFDLGLVTSLMPRDFFMRSRELSNVAQERFAQLSSKNGVLRLMVSMCRSGCSSFLLCCNSKYGLGRATTTSDKLPL